MGHLLLLMKMKLLGLIPLIFGIIALMAGKALLLGKLALLLSLIVALKKLLASHHQKTVTYEIVSHPHSSGGGHDSYSAGASDYSSYSGGGGSSGGSSHGGWGRSADAHSMAYKAYKPVDVKTD